jgi:MATE family multidrug resistance protein
VSSAAPSQPWSVGAELKALWRLALPLALAQAGQATMGLVDTAVLGRLSATAQAGAGLGNSLVFTVSFFGMGVMLALDPLVSQAIGAGRPREAREHLWQGVWLALLTSVPVMAVTAVVPLLLPACGVAPEVAAPAASFMWWRLPGVPAALLFITLRSYLSGTGRTAATFLAVVVANLANLGLDLLLVFGAGPLPALGVQGSALSTTLSTCLQLGVLALGLGPAPEGTRRRLDRPAVRRAARLGAPVGLHFLAESGVFSLTGVLAARLGAAASAAHTIALTLGSLTFCVAMGIGSAAATRVGWGVGAGDLVRARRAGLVAFGSVTAFMLLASALFLAAPEALGRLMSADPEVIGTVVSLVFVCAVFQVSDGLQAVGAGVLRGAGETDFTFRANALGHWGVGLPVSLLLGFGLGKGVVGLWWGLSLGLTLVAWMVVRRFLRQVGAPAA